MTRSSLHVATDADAAPESVGQRIRTLQAEAQRLAREHVSALLASMAQTALIAREIAEGGPVYHDGAQERARQIANELESQRQTLEQIAGRVE